MATPLPDLDEHLVELPNLDEHLESPQTSPQPVEKPGLKFNDADTYQGGMGGAEGGAPNPQLPGEADAFAKALPAKGLAALNGVNAAGKAVVDLGTRAVGATPDDNAPGPLASLASGVEQAASYVGNKPYSSPQQWQQMMSQAGSQNPLEDFAGTAASPLPGGPVARVAGAGLVNRARAQLEGATPEDANKAGLVGAGFQGAGELLQSVVPYVLKKASGWTKAAGEANLEAARAAQMAAAKQAAMYGVERTEMGIGRLKNDPANAQLIEKLEAERQALVDANKEFFQSQPAASLEHAQNKIDEFNRLKDAPLGAPGEAHYTVSGALRQWVAKKVGGRYNLGLIQQTAGNFADSLGKGTGLVGAVTNALTRGALGIANKKANEDPEYRQMKNEENGTD